MDHVPVVIEVVVGRRWWCDCGHTINPDRGAAQLIREHCMTCSWANRRPASNWWVSGMTVRYPNGRPRKVW